jgi:hypothetical protein
MHRVSLYWLLLAVLVLAAISSRLSSLAGSPQSTVWESSESHRSRNWQMKSPCSIRKYFQVPNEVPVIQHSWRRVVEANWRAIRKTAW